MLRIGNEPMMRWSACEGQARPEWIAKEIQWVGREELFERERETGPDMDGWTSCVAACEEAASYAALA